MVPGISGIVIERLVPSRVTVTDPLADFAVALIVVFLPGAASWPP